MAARVSTIDSPARRRCSTVKYFSAVGASASAFFDRMRGYRLMKWLRGDLGQPAPRDAAFWGELGYRFERAMRLRDQAIVTERVRELGATDVDVSIEVLTNLNEENLTTQTRSGEPVDGSALQDTRVNSKRHTFGRTSGASPFPSLRS